jgi:hypothetical protein
MPNGQSSLCANSNAPALSSILAFGDEKKVSVIESILVVVHGMT